MEVEFNIFVLLEGGGGCEQTLKRACHSPNGIKQIKTSFRKGLIGVVCAVSRKVSLCWWFKCVLVSSDGGVLTCPIKYLIK